VEEKELASARPITAPRAAPPPVLAAVFAPRPFAALERVWVTSAVS